MKVGCVLMAAGAARRFGRNKLLAEYEGVPLYRRALACIPGEEFAGVAVVSHYEEILAAGRKLGYTAVYNPAPEDGVSRTIAMGMDALPGMDALMFLVADQPLLRRESVSAELRFFRAHPRNIIAMGHGGRRGNPAIFPKAYFPLLYELAGDEGGSRVIRAHGEALLLHEIGDPLELMDVDTAAELAALGGTDKNETNERRLHHGNKC